MPWVELGGTLVGRKLYCLHLLKALYCFYQPSQANPVRCHWVSKSYQHLQQSNEPSFYALLPLGCRFVVILSRWHMCYNPHPDAPDMLEYSIAADACNFVAKRSMYGAAEHLYPLAHNFTSILHYQWPSVTLEHGEVFSWPVAGWPCGCHVVSNGHCFLKLFGSIILQHVVYLYVANYRVLSICFHIAVLVSLLWCAPNSSSTSK